MLRPANRGFIDAARFAGSFCFASCRSPLRARHRSRHRPEMLMRC
jgi:hypothetical protein